MTNTNYDYDEFGSVEREEFDGVEEISSNDVELVAGGFGFYPGGGKPDKNSWYAEAVWVTLLTGGPVKGGHAALGYKKGNFRTRRRG
jgi:hypothetical protein